MDSAIVSVPEHFRTHSWVEATKALEEAIAAICTTPQFKACISTEHTADTPRRVAESYNELYSGIFIDPKSVLKTAFSDDYSEMVYVNDIGFISMCAHHNLPFFGKAHFAYLPDKKIVGLSKIPRLVEVLSRRPQVQEKLTKEIVGTFQEVVNPKGCGLVMEAYHLCMMIRGVKKETAYTKTTWLEGKFRKSAAVRSEFLGGIKKNGSTVWP